MLCFWPQIASCSHIAPTWSLAPSGGHGGQFVLSVQKKQKHIEDLDSLSPSLMVFISTGVKSADLQTTHWSSLQTDKLVCVLNAANLLQSSELHHCLSPFISSHWCLGDRDRSRFRKMRAGVRGGGGEGEADKLNLSLPLFLSLAPGVCAAAVGLSLSEDWLP